MNDITYCISSKCPKANTCDRWWMNNGIGAFENISMFDPYKKGVACEYYEKRHNEAIRSKTDRKVVKRKGAKLWKQRKKNTA